MPVKTANLKSKEGQIEYSKNVSKIVVVVVVIMIIIQLIKLVLH